VNVKTRTTQKLAKLAHTAFVEARRHVEEARALVGDLEQEQRSLGLEREVAARARDEAVLGDGASSAQLSLHADHAQWLRRRTATLMNQSREAEQALERCEAQLQLALSESKRTDAVHDRAVLEKNAKAALEEQREQDEYRPGGSRR
jgi:hypothetical protein